MYITNCDVSKQYYAKRSFHALLTSEELNVFGVWVGCCLCIQGKTYMCKEFLEKVSLSIA